MFPEDEKEADDVEILRRHGFGCCSKEDPGLKNLICASGNAFSLSVKEKHTNWNECILPSTMNTLPHPLKIIRTMEHVSPEPDPPTVKQGGVSIKENYRSKWNEEILPSQTENERKTVRLTLEKRGRDRWWSYCRVLPEMPNTETGGNPTPEPRTGWQKISPG